MARFRRKYARGATEKSPAMFARAHLINTTNSTDRGITGPVARPNSTSRRKEVQVTRPNTLVSPSKRTHFFAKHPRKHPPGGFVFQNEPTCKNPLQTTLVSNSKVHTYIFCHKNGGFVSQKHIWAPCRVVVATVLTNTSSLGLDSVLAEEAPFSKNCADYTCPITPCPVKLSSNDTPAKSISWRGRPVLMVR